VLLIANECQKRYKFDKLNSAKYFKFKFYFISTQTIAHAVDICQFFTQNPLINLLKLTLLNVCHPHKLFRN